MIEVTLKSVIDNLDTFQTISQKSEILPAVLAYKLTRILLQLENEINIFHKAREQLLNKYCQKDNNGQFITDEKGSILLQDGVEQNFNEEFNQLINTTIDLNVNKIKLNELEPLQLSLQQMTALMPYIEE